MLVANWIKTHSQAPLSFHQAGRRRNQNQKATASGVHQNMSTLWNCMSSFWIGANAKMNPAITAGHQRPTSNQAAAAAAEALRKRLEMVRTLSPTPGPKIAATGA